MAETLQEHPARKVVLLAIDASHQAEEAFQWYLAAVHRDCYDVHVLHVPECLDLDRDRMMYLTAASCEDALRKERTKVKELEDKYTAKLQESGTPGIVRCEEGGKPGEVICRVAAEEKAEMIVIGRRGLGRVRRTVLGSVSSYIVNHAHCPVIIYKH